MSDARTILVTGASQGIGLATARVFAGAGWRVVMAARSAEKLTGEAAALGATSVPTDVADPASVGRLFERIAADHGRLDAVFNNAGVNVPPTEPGDLDFAGWRSVISVNLDGAFLIASAAFRMMKAQDPQGGRIINNGSISAHAPRPGSVAYTTSKHAITGLTKTIALDGRPHRIACGQIDIGNAQSEMAARLGEGTPQADGSIRAEPLMDVTHVAEAVLAMASLPLESNILFQTIMATNMPFVGRG
ncbi:MAG: SDR family oxidoreductase [Pseudomonadota bacterium]